MSMICNVVLSRRSMKELRKVPDYIADKLMTWIAAVEKFGLEEVRRIPGYHDEPLNGKREGLRSIRLSRAYRAYYKIVDGEVEFVSVEGVDKHEYKKKIRCNEVS